MPPNAFVDPNLWSLSGGGIYVRYWTFTLGPILQGDVLQLCSRAEGRGK